MDTGLLSARDRERIAGIHPDLLRVVERARRGLTFFVPPDGGRRTRARQAELVAKGVSKAMVSRHLTGHAVDLVLWTDDGDGVIEAAEIGWNKASCARVAAAMKAAAAVEGVRLVWGGDWRSFYDGPHFELDRAAYP